MKQLKASLIISTYNQPKWLERVLWSFENQSEKDFEIIIADDGSTTETKSLIENFKASSSLLIKHVWHEDKGFRKTVILNKAIKECVSDYLIFTDGDCIARNDFIATHLRLQKKNCALSAGAIRLSKATSNAITKDDILTNRCFDKQWLIGKGQPKSFKLSKLTNSKFKASFLNTFTPTKATFDGGNVSAWKQDVLDVNGFDERMQYGGEDRELGERMMNNGVKFLQVRYSAICLHLHHERPYKNEAAQEKNTQIRKETKRLKTIVTPFGIEKI